MRPCTNFLYTMITFSSRIASFVSSGVLDASTSPACSSSPGRKAPAYVFSRDMLSVRENSVSIGTSTAQFEEEIRGVWSTLPVVPWHNSIAQLATSYSWQY